jgi:molybdate transport system regulatory protein
MRTSARNQFRGIVKDGAQAAPSTPTSFLTWAKAWRSSPMSPMMPSTNWSLAPGRNAVALIKSSFVVLSPDANIRVSARNQLRGTVTAIDAQAVSTPRSGSSCRAVAS